MRAGYHLANERSSAISPRHSEHRDPMEASMQTEQATAPATEELDLELISGRYFEAWEACDPDAISRLHTDDTRFHVHTGGEPEIGVEAVRAAFAGLFEQLPGFGFEVDRVLLGECHWVLDW